MTMKTNFTIFSDHEDRKFTESFTDRIFSALWLISLGILFLLNTIGIVPWSIWGDFAKLIIRIWPIFLIWAGISIIVDKLPFAKFLASALWYLLFVGLFFLVITRPDLTTQLPLMSPINLGN